tara:strand:- start:5477 stop:5713 length:237 start_codon:yes stop_codon:yes gene_type:complete
MLNDLQRIKKAIIRDRIARNTKTTLAVAIAFSGALVSTQAMGVTITLTLLSLFLLKERKKRVDEKNSGLNVIDDDSTF